ncbi:MAG: peptidoglycan D,D-transpeptidase FtsI family protein [Planctomycetota bacterium]
MKSVRIIIFFLFVVIAAFALLVGRCFYLQYLKASFYSSVSTSQQQAQVTNKPQRGVILDCRGRVLAASNKIQTIFAEPRIIENPESISAKLTPIVNMDAPEICRLIMESKNPGFAKIMVDADENYCNAVAGIYGIGVQSDWCRHYPTGPLACHVVGFTSTDNRGLGGIELQYDKELAGSAGESIFFADVLRRPVRLKQRNGVLKDGVGIILTLDSAIQQFARAELLKVTEDYEAESAVAIVAEPTSGAILAMVSLPDFDPGGISSAEPNSLLNRAVTDQFEPGSVFKPIVAAIALDVEAVALDEKIFCEQGNYVGRGFGRIGEYRNRKYGEMTVREILVRSSNIGMAKIGQKLGREKLHKGLKHFGFGKETGIELSGEAEGFLRPPQKWTGYSVTRIPFGQEISVTAIQLVRAFCILANGGRLVTPYLVRAMVDNEGKITKLKRPAPPVGYVIRPEVAGWIVTEALVGVVNEGTGKRARLDKWQVFGKTGTANIASSEQRGYDENAYVASFIAGAPAQQPEVVILVSIRKPNTALGKGYTGGTVAAPVAAKILEKTLTYLQKRKG